jgi:hypothetical protein
MRSTTTPFRTRQEVDRYFSGKTIKCLLCGERFRRLSFHLFAKHGMSADDYKSRFGLPWTRGLTSATSHCNSGWNAERRIKASKQARKSRFFELAHPVPRREDAPFLKLEWARNLGGRAAGFGPKFERRVRALFEKGLNDTAIARALDVNRSTVRRRTRRWRKPKIVEMRSRRGKEYSSKGPFLIGRTT